MPDKLKRRIVEQMGDVPAAAREEIVHAQHFMPLGQKPLTEVRAKESGAAGHENPFLLEIAPAHARTLRQAEVHANAVAG